MTEKKMPNLIHKIIKNLTDTVSDLENQIPRWISLEERFPEKFKDVLAFGSDGIIIGQYCGECFMVWSTTMNRLADHITHWMPLPEPPE